MCNAVGHRSYRAILSAFGPSKLSKCQKNAPLVRYFNTYLLVITANALKYKYTRLREYITVSDAVTCIGVITPVYYPSLVFLALTPKQKRAASSGSKSKIYRAQVYLRTARVVHTEIKTAKKDHGRNGGKAESRAIAMKHTPCKKKQCSAQYRALGKRVSFTSHTTKHI